uniref:Uncharacterized protein n=1 Tax=Avena sativa TaxID=4498 RepID=A0ACD5ZQS9_AVESA
MASVRDVAVLALSVAEFMEPLLCFLGGHSPRSPAVNEAAVFLLVFIPMARIAGDVVAHFAGVILAYLHQASGGGGTAMSSLADLGRFVVLLFTLVSAWLFAVAVLLAFFYVFLVGKEGIRPGLSWNVLG